MSAPTFSVWRDRCISALNSYWPNYLILFLPHPPVLPDALSVALLVRFTRDTDLTVCWRKNVLYTHMTIWSLTLRKEHNILKELRIVEDHCSRLHNILTNKSFLIYPFYRVPVLFNEHIPHPLVKLQNPRVRCIHEDNPVFRIKICRVIVKIW